MTLGEKIKKARKAKKLTQSALAGNVITRNMLSRIESNSATPSLDTLRYLAEELSLPVAYFMSEDDDLSFYEKKEVMKKIYDAIRSGDLAYCVKKIESLSAIDNELAYILTYAYSKLSLKSLENGALNTASDYVDKAIKYSKLTVFDTSHSLLLLPLYKAIATNIQAPLLMLDKDALEEQMRVVGGVESYKYILQDIDFEYTNPVLKMHSKAKKLIKERDYYSAIRLLEEAAEINKNEKFNAVVVFGIYSDLELCYKNIYDFENAYKYSSKRMSMLEGFKS